MHNERWFSWSLLPLVRYARELTYWHVVAYVIGTLHIFLYLL